MLESCAQPLTIPLLFNDFRHFPACTVVKINVGEDWYFRSQACDCKISVLYLPIKCAYLWRNYDSGVASYGPIEIAESPMSWFNMDDNRWYSSMLIFKLLVIHILIPGMGSITLQSITITFQNFKSMTITITLPSITFLLLYYFLLHFTTCT